MGGYSAATGLSKPVATLYRYNPTTDHWSTLPSAPSARAAHTMAVIGDRLYVAGGARGGKALKTLEIYDLKRRKWSTGPSMKTPRQHPTGPADPGAFYLPAGRPAGQGKLKVAARYDP